MQLLFFSPNFPAANFSLFFLILVNPSFPVPKVIPSKDEYNKQQMVQDKHGNNIILFTFVKGTFLTNLVSLFTYFAYILGKVGSEIFKKNLGSQENLNFLFNLGATLAKLQKTLHGFFH